MVFVPHDDVFAKSPSWTFYCNVFRSITAAPGRLSLINDVLAKRYEILIVKESNLSFRNRGSSFNLAREKPKMVEVVTIFHATTKNK